MTAAAMSRDAREKLLGMKPEDYIATLPEAHRKLFGDVDLGMDIEDFLQRHPVGKFLADVIEIERTSAMEALVASMTDDINDHKTHNKHYLRVAVCNQIKNWLIDALELGQAAQRELELHEHTD